VIAFVMAVSPHFRDRASAVVSEARAYSQGDQAPTSSGVRLNYWQRSVEAIAERPLTGYGVGSWNTEYRRLQGSQLRADAVHVRNPHQEYLLWGVQLGLGGIALLLAFGATIWRDASHFAPAERGATQSLLIVLAVVCLFNSALFDALIGDYFCVLLGLLLALGLHGKTEASPA
jgi:O-antigen ligase